MSRHNVFLVALFLVVSTFPLSFAYPQQVPAVSAPECVNIPGQPCNGVSRPGSTSQHSMSTSSTVSGAIASTLADSFFQLLFSNDSQANAQKQKMLAELAQRQAEAERQHKIEEAKRLAAICDQLRATLKLTGLPDLQLKSDGATSGGGGLQLKLGDGDSYQVVNYLKEPLSPPTPPSGSGPLSGGALQLKTGEGDTSSMAVASAPSAPPAPADGAAPADTVTNARNMTPQQLADLATQVNSLPPAEQQRLMDAAKANAQAANNEAASQSTASAAPSKPVMSQLQQIAGASQAAAAAPGLDGAAAIARVGFDQPIYGAPKPGVAPAGTSVPVSVPNPPPSQLAAASRPASGPSSGSSAAPAQVFDLTPFPGGTKPEPVGTSVQKKVEVAEAPCPPGIEKVIPSRQQLQRELAVRHAQLESLKNTIVRLNRTIQLDQQQFAVWEDEANAAVNRLNGRIWDMWTKAAFEKFIDYEEKHFKTMPLPPYERAEKLQKLELVKNIKDFGDYTQWALTHKNEWEQIDGFIRQIIDLSSLKNLDWEPLFYIHCAQYLIDNAYDASDFTVTWNNVQQLDHNSMQFLEAVRQSGERMKAIVGRIQQIEAQLNSTPEGPQGASPCREVQMGAKAR